MGIQIFHPIRLCVQETDPDLTRTRLKRESGKCGGKGRESEYIVMSVVQNYFDKVVADVGGGSCSKRRHQDVLYANV
jgi:hypothetical protein